MNDAIASILLLACTVGALLAMRSRAALVQIAVETALLLAIGLFLAMRGTSPLPHFAAVPLGMLGAWYRALAVVWWLIGARLVVKLTAIARGRDPKSREARLFSELAAAIIYITAVLIIFNSVLDLNINGLLATSGVVAIVLGLALQTTLADVFSGIAVGLEQPFHVGDRVSLGENIEGIIVQMNWRSVRIRTDDDDLATLPNSIVAKGRIVNHSVPTHRRAATMEIKVPVAAAVAQVFELMRQAPLLCPDVLADPAPSVSLHHVGARHFTFATRFFVADSAHLGGARSMLLRQTFRMLRHAGVGGEGPMAFTALLGSIVMFEALSPADLADLAAHVTVHALEPGDVVFEQDAPSCSICVVADGVMELSRHVAEPAKDTVGRVGPGEYIGEIGLITGRPRNWTMKALTRGCVLEVPGDCLRDLLGTNKALSAAMELSVRRGLASLDRDDAAREAHPAAQTPDLLARIKAFFGLAAGPAGPP